MICVSASIYTLEVNRYKQRRAHIPRDKFYVAINQQYIRGRSKDWYMDQNLGASNLG